MEQILGPIGACGLIGAFIDFVLGKKRQRKLKAWLVLLQQRMGRVTLRNFGAEEAMFALSEMDRLFGRSIFTRRRVAFVAAAAAFSELIGVGLPLAYAWATGEDFSNINFAIAGEDVAVCILGLVLFTASLSITRTATARAVSILRAIPKLNFVVLFFVLILQYVLFCFWDIILDSMVYALQISYIEIMYGDFNFAGVSEGFSTAWRDVVSLIHPDIFYPSQIGDFFAMIVMGEFGKHGLRNFFNVSYMNHILELLANFGRFALTFVFAMSYFMKPFLTSASSLIDRLVESDKPVFTLIFGGAAAFAKFLQEVARLF